MNVNVNVMRPAVIAALFAISVGCGSKPQSSPPPQPTAAATTTATPDATASAPASSASAAPPPSDSSAATATTDASAADSPTRFDRGSNPLAGINVQSCKQPNGPTGAGHVRVTFGPDGAVSNVNLDAGPFTASTPTGKCVIERYRTVHIAPNNGAMREIGKSFAIN